MFIGWSTAEGVSVAAEVVMKCRGILSFILACALGVLFVGQPYAQQGQYYVLDGFGGVHAGGGAGALSGAPPYFGFDIARGIAYAPGVLDGGILVLDGFGGVHTIGLGAVVPATPYFGFDVARGITYKNIPPRAAGVTDATNHVLSSPTYQSIVSATVNAPDDGYVLVFATAGTFCTTSSGAASAQFSLSVNSLTPDPALDLYHTDFTDCSNAAPGLGVPIEPIALTKLFAVGPGAQTVYLIGRRNAGTVNVSVSGASIVAVFVDHDGSGSS